MSLITEGALDRARLAEYGRRAAIESARLVVPAALLVVLAAPVLLDLMGGDYSAEATNLLRLLALSAIPYVVVATAANVARVERKLSRVIAIYGTLSVMVLGMSWLLLEQIGIVGVGVAWLIAQSIVCTAILAPALLGRLARQIPSPLLRIAAAPYHALGRGARRRRAVSAAPSILSAMGCGEFATVHALDGDGSVAVVRVSAPDGRSAIAKFGVTAEGSAAVERNARLVEELQQDERLAPFRATLPEIWTSYAGDPRATLERDIPGVRLDSLLGGPHRRPALAAAVAAIEKIHEATSVDVTVDDDVLEVLVERPLRAISLIRATDRTPDNLADAVRGRLRGSTLRMSRTHGDFTPRNILVRPDGTAVEGIVDWEGSSPLDIPELDLAHLALAVRMHDTGRELGALVKVLVTQPGTPSLGCELGRRSLGLEGLHDSEGLLAMLAWLRHAEINIAKSDRYAPGSVWFDRNIEPVLTTLSSTWRATPLPPASRA
jgi:hypothetical protein